MAVLKTTSPERSAGAPKLLPSKTVPSSKARIADSNMMFLLGVGNPHFSRSNRVKKNTGTDGTFPRLFETTRERPVCPRIFFDTLEHGLLRRYLECSCHRLYPARVLPAHCAGSSGSS